MNRKRRYYVYIKASRSLNLYPGVTDDIFRRVLEHKSGTMEGFTKRYNINRLVYYRTFPCVNKAIARGDQVKACTRAMRIALIKTLIPTWQDLTKGWGEKVELQIPRSAGDDHTVKDPANDDQHRAISTHVQHQEI